MDIGSWHGTLCFLFLSHLLYRICVKIFIMNRYISKSYTTTKKCYWPTIYRAGTGVVSTITSISANIIASHAGVFRGARFSPIPREGWNKCSPKNACVGGYQYHFSNLIWYFERGARNVPSGEERGETDVFAGYEREGAVVLGSE